MLSNHFKFRFFFNDWEIGNCLKFKWNLDKSNNIVKHQLLDCRKGRITFSKELIKLIIITLT